VESETEAGCAVVVRYDDWQRRLFDGRRKWSEQQEGEQQAPYGGAVARETSRRDCLDEGKPELN
jgi:hypothetical protein